MALFDLDGTLTRHDTLGQYVLGFVRRHPACLLRLPLVLPALGRFLLGAGDRGELKAALLHALLGLTPRQELQQWTQAFVVGLVKRGLHADARAALAGHLAAGDTLALLSASPDLYVPAIAAALGIADVTCTGLAWRDERLSGALTSVNRRGAEKVRCLTALRERHPGMPVVAYGNARSDLAHLALADRGVLVNGSRTARRDAARLKIGTVTWR